MFGIFPLLLSNGFLVVFNSRCDGQAEGILQPGEAEVAVLSELVLCDPMA